MSNPDFDATYNFVMKILEKELPKNLYYHGIHHTRDIVFPAARLLAYEQRVQGEDLIILLTGALYHDIGYTKQYKSNEPVGVQIVQQTLPNFGYSSKQVEAVSNIILATRIPQQPKNFLEELMCDADLDNLGRPDFFEIGDTLRREYIKFGIIHKSITDKEWYQIQLKFLQEHSYFTRAARFFRDWQKRLNIEELKSRLAV